MANYLNDILTVGLTPIQTTATVVGASLLVPIRPRWECGQK